MNRMLRLALLLILVCSSGVAFAQNSGIKGVLKDEKGNPIVNANVVVSEGGIMKGRDLTDFDGNYTVKPLSGGNYEVKFSYLGKDLTITGIILAGDQTITVNGKLTTTAEVTQGGKKVVAEVHAVRGFQAPLIDPESPGGKTVKSGDQIDKAPTRNTSDLAALSTQVYQGGSGGGLSIGGARTSGTKYIIDGVQVSGAGFTNQAPGSVETITTFSSGIPARYGDASGGLVTITTRGATSRTQGNVQFEHSVEGYNQNQLTANLSGPLFSRKDSNGAKRPLIGYSLSADGVYAEDQSPIYNKTYYVKDDILSGLQAHPLRQLQTNGVTTTEYAAQFIHDSDLVQKKKQPNALYYRGNLNGKLDFNVTDNVSVRVGASYFGNDVPSYSRAGSLFNSDNFTRSTSQTGRGFIRFTQKFGNNNRTDEVKDNAISNAFYTVQADYQKDFTSSQDKNKKQNTFEYGYIGKFEEQYVPVYQAGGIDDSTGKVGIKLLGYSPTAVVFTPGTQNPGLANYTKDYYNFTPFTPATQIQIQAGKGLRNGDGPPSVYNLWTGVNAASGGWSKSSSDQVAVQVDASFDLKQKKLTHSVEFGLYYQQRNVRSYSVSGAGIWGLMRQATNRVVNQEVDMSKPYWIKNGIYYSRDDVDAGRFNPGPLDTIHYARKFDRSAQGAFDAHLRKALGADTSAYINTDNIDPNFYSLDMFSADDLLNSGSSLVSYTGYDYLGNPVNGQVNFNDFWTKKDAEGYYTRPIGAYRPNYIAGYLSDYIQYKDFRITLGVRVERFDNNTKVLKDPYSLYAVKTVSNTDLSKLSNPAGGVYTKPDNIGGDYVVYVGDNNSSSPQLIGYRNGDTWYDASGREVQDPALLVSQSGANGLQPLLQNPKVRMKDADYKPDESFTDYKPQVHAMPRINFSFPLNENALFYAHYDVLYQRPTVGSFARQTDYFFLEQNPTNIIGNSDLKPERAIDYEVGFQQKLTDRSSVTISGFYKERKDQIQVRPYLYAFPITYYTYGNRDYSTYKGLSINYDLRRIGNLSMNINYTLSFSEGTGSDERSSSNLLTQLVAEHLPNLRTSFPLDNDSRHNINAQIDYRFRDGGGPTVGNKHILENSGIQLIFTARSGEPYTKYATAQNLQSGASNSPLLDGAVNGSRLTGHYNIDVNIDKNIPLKFGKQKEGARPSRLGLNIYAYAKNVFNIRDVRGVYGYTGRPDDDGYLTSPQGLTEIPGKVDVQSFLDLYTINANNPYFIGNPRTILIGLRLNF